MLSDLPVEIRDHVLSFASGPQKLTNSWGYAGPYTNTHPLTESVRLHLLMNQVCKELTTSEEIWKYLVEQRTILLRKAAPTETALSILSKLGCKFTYKKLAQKLQHRITAKAMIEVHNAIQTDNAPNFSKLCLHFPHFITDHILIAPNHGFWYENTLILPKLAPQTSIKVPWDGTIFNSAKSIDRQETQTVIDLIKHNKNQKIGKLCGIVKPQQRKLRPRPKLK